MNKFRYNQIVQGVLTTFIQGHTLLDSLFGIPGATLFLQINLQLTNPYILMEWKPHKYMHGS